MGKSGAPKKNLSAAFAARGASKGSALASAKKDKLARLENPFLTRDNKRQRHVVLNRKLKGAERNVALSRGLAYEKRKRTLLTELKGARKANAFVDRRFGEKGQGLTEEEKVLERFKRLRSKKSLYDLSDTDASRKRKADVLTHLGQSLGSDDAEGAEMKEFEKLLREEGLEEEDAPEERIDAAALMERIKALGGGGPGGLLSAREQGKSKKEVMEEVIAKAKIFKVQRQKEKEEDEDERERLDGAFRGLMQEGAFHVRPTKAQHKQQEVADMLARLEAAKEGKPLPKPSENDEEAQAPEDEEYERTVRGLQFEARAAATDRTMTPEEAAKKDLAKLEEQQKKLERRMNGVVSDDEDSDEEALSGRKRARKRKANKGKAGGAEDAFFGEDEGEDGDGDENQDEEEDEEEGEEEEDDDDDDGGEEQDEKDDGDEELEKELERQRKEFDNPKAKKKAAVSVDARAEIIAEARGALPFLLDVPGSHLALVELLQRHPESPLTEVLQRVRKTNSVHIKAENRFKLGSFLAIVLEHLVMLVELRAQGKAQKQHAEDSASNDIKACLSALYELAHDVPECASQVFVNRLVRMQAVLGAQLGAASEAPRGGGDYGCDLIDIIKPGDLSLHKKGGHKVRPSRARRRAGGRAGRVGERVKGGGRPEKDPNHVKFPCSELAPIGARTQPPEPGANDSEKCHGSDNQRSSPPVAGKPNRDLPYSSAGPRSRAVDRSAGRGRRRRRQTKH
jgi:nucleolar protein 14